MEVLLPLVFGTLAALALFDGESSDEDQIADDMGPGDGGSGSGDGDVLDPVEQRIDLPTSRVDAASHSPTIVTGVAECNTIVTLNDPGMTLINGDFFDGRLAIEPTEGSESLSIYQLQTAFDPAVQADVETAVELIRFEGAMEIPDGSLRVDYGENGIFDLIVRETGGGDDAQTLDIADDALLVMDTGDGEDDVALTGRGDGFVDLGAGNDSFDGTSLDAPEAATTLRQVEDDPNDPETGFHYDFVAGDAFNSPVTSDQVIVDGGDGNDMFTLGANATEVHGGDGDDTVMLGQGDALVHGGDGADVVDGTGADGSDATRVIMGDADDTVTGSDGTDLIWGGTVDARGGDDVVHAAGDATLAGGEGDDRLITDLPLSNAQSSTRDVELADVVNVNTISLDGGAGDDYLSGGINTTMTGGTGADDFNVYYLGNADQDAAVITDFDPSEDNAEIVIDPAEFGLAGSDDALIVLSENGGDTTVSIEGIDVLMLQNVTGLSAADIRVSAFSG